VPSIARSRQQGSETIMLSNPTFWVAVALVIFLVIVHKAGAFAKVGNQLDARGRKIADDLAEAKRLRAEAEALVAEYEAKRKAAEGEAAAIVEQAKADAERIRQETQAKLDEFVIRRKASAEAKIAQAEMQAFADVKAAAAQAAVQAAEAVLRQTVVGPAAEAYLAKGLGEVKSRLN
jgi:F-type H+-transporting ATPase subunit b